MSDEYPKWATDTSRDTKYPRAPRPNERVMVTSRWHVDKGLPIPAPHSRVKTGRSEGLITALREIDPGDSIFVSTERGGLGAASNSVRYLNMHYKGTERRYVYREATGGARVWRES